MTNSNDMTKMMQDMLSNFPVDMSSLQEGFKTQASLGEKMSKVAIAAAETSSAISAKWTKETLEKVGGVTAAKNEPADYSQAVTDFASTQAELAAENLAAFAEVAKKVQMETIDLMLAAGKDAGEDLTAAAKKATDEVTKATKKATAAAK